MTGQDVVNNPRHLLVSSLRGANDFVQSVLDEVSDHRYGAFSFSIAGNQQSVRTERGAEALPVIPLPSIFRILHRFS